VKQGERIEETRLPLSHSTCSGQEVDVQRRVAARIADRKANLVLSGVLRRDEG
jgi:hypothetical protein